MRFLPFAAAAWVLSGCALAAAHAADAPAPPAPAPQQVLSAQPRALPPLPELEYPEAARLAGHHGLVDVHLVVGPDGSVISARIGRSSRSVELDEAVLRAMRAVRFTPPLDLQGQPTSAGLWRGIRFEVAPALTLRCSEFTSALTWFDSVWPGRSPLELPMWLRLAVTASNASDLPQPEKSARQAALLAAGRAACKQHLAEGRDPLATPLLKAEWPAVAAQPLPATAP